MLNAARTFFPDMEVHTYAGADHAFANEHRPAAYLEETAKLAHARAAAFIAAHV
jgi:carboxymethylenebutenolidase